MEVLVAPPKHTASSIWPDIQWAVMSGSRHFAWVRWTYSVEFYWARDVSCVRVFWSLLLLVCLHFCWNYPGAYPCVTTARRDISLCVLYFVPVMSCLFNDLQTIRSSCALSLGLCGFRLCYLRMKQVYVQWFGNRGERSAGEHSIYMSWDAVSWSTPYKPKAIAGLSAAITADIAIAIATTCYLYRSRTGFQKRVVPAKSWKPVN